MKEGKIMNMKQEHHQGHNKEELIKSFGDNQLIMEEIYKNGFSSYVESLKDLSKAFEGNDHCIRCMDEGTPGGLHSAGSGILRDEAEVLKAFKKAGVKKITSHDGCGAAGLYAKANNLDVSKADEYGKEFAKNLAKKLGIPYEHISSSEMNRPSNNHIARIAYYDNTGDFNYTKVKGLPAGFIISRGIQGAKDSIAEAIVAVNIATGDHGFGSLITDENPFVISVIAKNKGELEKIQSELSGLKESFGKKIIIDGFIAPKKHSPYDDLDEVLKEEQSR